MVETGTGAGWLHLFMPFSQGAAIFTDSTEPLTTALSHGLASRLLPKPLGWMALV